MQIEENVEIEPSVCIILSGGTGSRLWPLSRESYPKPFIKLPDGESFLKKTFERAKKLGQVEEILTVTHRDHYFRVQNEYKNDSSSIKTSYLLEPHARNTGPAIISSTLYLQNFYDSDTVLFILPSDHLIKDIYNLRKAAKKAYSLAKQGNLVTFGIKPTYPETGYGYIEVDAETSLSNIGEEIDILNFLGKRFHEKPDMNTALYYMNAKHYFWNSGMFCFTIKTFLEEMTKWAPQLLNLVVQSFSDSALHNVQHCMYLNEESYAKLPHISIDYALMEKSDHLSVVVSDFGWSDVGTWAAMSSLADADHDGNHINGKAVVHDTTDCYIHSTHRTVGTIGLNNLVIVDMADALLIADRNRTQEVKQVVQHLKTKNDKTLQEHVTVYRPWGQYTILEQGMGYKIKEVRVKSCAALSLQMHHHRSEHWIVISGIAEVTHDNKRFILKKNESTFIPAGCRHRLENPDTEEDLVIIEVQSGDYLEEDDIVRYDDLYGRL